MAAEFVKPRVQSIVEIRNIVDAITQEVGGTLTASRAEGEFVRDYSQDQAKDLIIENRMWQQLQSVPSKVLLKTAESEWSNLALAIAVEMRRVLSAKLPLKTDSVALEVCHRLPPGPNVLICTVNKSGVITRTSMRVFTAYAWGIVNSIVKASADAINDDDDDNNDGSVIAVSQKSMMEMASAELKQFLKL